MFELKSMSYEESRAEHFEYLMKKMQRKIDYWQYRGRYSLKPMGELSRANIECSEAGMQYNFYKDALEALAAQPKWISVEERLPPVGEIVLVYSGGIRLLAFIDCTDVWYRTIINFKLPGTVTHWMPLPSTEGIE
jgi:hypothetical protein